MWKRDEAVKPTSRPPPTPAAQSQGGPAPSPQPETRQQIERDVVNIGKSVVIKGELNGSEDLTIEGQVEGKIELKDHVLTIGPNGKIKAQVFAKAVIVLGEVNGNVTATEKVEIRDGGSVDGDIVSPRVAIAEGAHFRGSVDMQRKAAAAGPGRAAAAAAASARSQPRSRSSSAISQVAAAGRIADAYEERWLSPISSRAGARTTTAPTTGAAALGCRPFSRRGRWRRFLTGLGSRQQPVLLDLGPVVGSNVTFFGEEVGCKIFVEDLSKDIDRHVHQSKLEDLPAFFDKRFPQEAEHDRRHSLLGHLRLPRAARRPSGSRGSSRACSGPTACCSRSSARPIRVPRPGPTYTRHVVVDRAHLQYRPYQGRARQAAAAAESGHPAAVRAAAHHRELPAQDEPARSAVPQARGSPLRRPRRPRRTAERGGLMARPVIALLTDFGTRDHYAGTMKGVALGICPDATFVDITHDIAPHDVLGGALELAASYKYFPAGTSLPGRRRSRRRVVAAGRWRRRPAATGSSRPTTAC